MCDPRDFLRNIPLFNELDEEEFLVASKYIGMIEVEMDFEPVVFREGDEGDYVCFVAEGNLDVIKQGEDGHTATIATLARGDSIGEMALVDSLERSATVRATENSRLMVMTKRDFDFMFEENPTVGIKMLKGLARTLSIKLRKTSTEVVK